MKKLLVIFLCSFSTIFSFCQSSLNEMDNSFNQSLTKKEISAHQYSSLKKITDFYEYLSLYSNQKDKELKNELKTSIQNLFNSSNEEIIDVTNTNFSSITLNEFLEKIDGKNYQFQIIDQKTLDILQNQFWINEYTLKVTASNYLINNKVHQKVYFKKVNKEFGGNTKIVWEMKLGEMTR